jgi:hypothetical protein
MTSLLCGHIMDRPTSKAQGTYYLTAMGSVPTITTCIKNKSNEISVCIILMVKHLKTGADPGMESVQHRSDISKMNELLSQSSRAGVSGFLGLHPICCVYSLRQTT